jgi:XTP/dITP diphosphohydrolase
MPPQVSVYCLIVLPSDTEKGLSAYSQSHDDDLSNYTIFIKERFMPFVSNGTDSNELFIATKNQSKLADYKLYLGNTHNISNPNDVDITLDVPEGIDSIEENALAKARAWSAVTHKISLGDDTGFFINALFGEPGVATRRWAGELPESTTGEEFWRYLQQKTENLEDLSCYFEQCIVLYAPNGNYRTVRSRNNGILNREKLTLPYNGSGYPLSAAFESMNRLKTWDEMTDVEKVAFDHVLIDDLRAAINDLRGEMQIGIISPSN